MVDGKKTAHFSRCGCPGQITYLFNGALPIDAKACPYYGEDMAGDRNALRGRKLCVRTALAIVVS